MFPILGTSITDDDDVPRGHYIIVVYYNIMLHSTAGNDK